MKKDTTYVALDDSQNAIVAGILAPRATEPELRQFPNEPRHLRRLFARLQREGPWWPATRRGPRATTSTGNSRQTGCPVRPSPPP